MKSLALMLLFAGTAWIALGIVQGVRVSRRRARDHKQRRALSAERYATMFATFENQN